MNTELAQELEYAIDKYNDEVEEDLYLYWWDVLNEMTDLTDDKQVMQTIKMIESKTEEVKAGA